MAEMPKASAIAVLVRLRVHLGHEGAFRDELQRIVARVRDEPACLAIEGHQDRDDPTRFMLFEEWRSAEEFAEFEQGRAYMREYFERVEPLWSAPREMTIWHRIGGA